MHIARPPQALPRPHFDLLREVSEPEADGRLRQIYEDIRLVLGVSLVNAVFRALGVYPRYLEEAWAAMRPNLLTPAFDLAANRIRVQAAAAAGALTRPGPAGADLGRLRRLGYLPEDIGHLARGMAAFHYVNPKLLLWVAGLRLASGQIPGVAPGIAGREHSASGPVPAPPMGDPVPIHLVPPDEAPPGVAAIYRAVQEQLFVPVVNSDFQFLGGYPSYLADVAPDLLGLMREPGFDQAGLRLGALAVELAGRLPYRVELKAHDPGAQALLDLFHSLLPRLILAVAAISRRLGIRQDRYLRA